MSDGDFEVVTPERYRELLQAERILNALRAGGVDNWEYYDDALAALGEDDDE